jgi:hypothetical protein
VALTIAKDAVNYGAQVELGAKSVEHHSMINARGGEGSLVNLEHKGTLRWLPPGVDNGIELEGHLINLNGLKRQGDKHIVRLRCNRTGHGNDRWRRAYRTKRRWGLVGYGTMTITQQGTG